MRFALVLVCVCGLFAGAALGCSEDEGNGGAGGTAGSGGAGANGGDAGNGGSAGTGGVEMIEYNIRLTGVEPDGTHPSMPDVEVCVVGTENCVMSNELGTATFSVPMNEEIAITFEKEGYGKWVMADVSNEDREDGATRRMYTNEQLEAVATQLNVTYPWTIVGLAKFPSSTEGLTFAAVGSTAGEVGEEFYYDSTTEEYSTELTSATFAAQNWYLPLGAGGFTEVTAGEQVFEFGGTAGDCVASWSWPGDEPNTIRVPVIEGYRTYGSMRCE